jgi:hypothetical protein
MDHGLIHPELHSLGNANHSTLPTFSFWIAISWGIRMGFQGTGMLSVSRRGCFG